MYATLPSGTLCESVEVVGLARITANSENEYAQFEAYRIHKIAGEDPASDLLACVELRRGLVLRFKFGLNYNAEDSYRFVESQDVEVDVRAYPVKVPGRPRTTEIDFIPAQEPVPPQSSAPHWSLEKGVLSAIVPYIDCCTVFRLAQCSRGVNKVLCDPAFWAMTSRDYSRNLPSLPAGALHALTFKRALKLESRTVQSGISIITSWHRHLPQVVKSRLRVWVQTSTPINLFCGEHCDLADQGIPCSWVEGNDFGWATAFDLSAGLMNAPLKCMSSNINTQVQVQFYLM